MTMTPALPRDPLKLMAQIGALCSDLAAHDRALVIFEHLALLRGDDPNALVALALAQSRSGDEATALATLERALQADPRHDMARAMLAIHWHRRGDPRCRELLQAVLSEAGPATDADALALAEAVRDDILMPAPPADTAPLAARRHRYTRLATP